MEDGPAPLPLPMKAVAGELPPGDGWAFEVKWDGMRAVVGIAGGRARIQSASGNDITVAFPELAGIATALGVDSAVLDGEIVALDANGRPDFGRLQSRIHVTSSRAASERATSVPCTLFVFDLLELDGRALTGLAWQDRRRLLDALVVTGPHWQLSPVHDDGSALLDAARSRNLEGVVAKRRDSRYHPGTRTREWVKVKVRHRQEFVVGGWTPGRGGRASSIGGLLLGVHDQPGVAVLRYVGRVGSGLDDAAIARLRSGFDATATTRCPFDPPPPRTPAVHWVDPTIVVEVAFAEWTRQGRLRHPTFVGVRTDVDPSSVTARP